MKNLIYFLSGILLTVCVGAASVSVDVVTFKQAPVKTLIEKFDRGVDAFNSIQCHAESGYRYKALIEVDGHLILIMEK